MNLFRTSSCSSIILALLLVIIMPTMGLKILAIFPHFGKSHYDVLHPLVLGLANKGYEVSVISHFPNNPPVKNFRHLSLEGTLPQISPKMTVGMFNSYFKNLQVFLFIMTAADMTCRATYESKVVKHLIKSKEHFDVVITEPFNTDCMLGLVHHLNAPHISLSTHALMPWAHDRFGNPDNPATIPNCFGSYSTEMSFFQRLDNFLYIHFYKILYYLYSDIPSDKLLKEVFGPDIPSVGEIKKDTALIFVNLHYSMSGVRPQVPAVVDIGGIHVKPPKPLEKDLENFINSAEHGVIYVSWGSMIQSSTLPITKRDALLKAFGSLKQRVVWKWENESLPNQPKNVLIKKWMPQRDVLGHKNVRLFMSHGGLLGTTEAVHSGVPVIVTPHFGDQPLNSAALQARGIGLELPYEDITTENVLKVINAALQPSFAQNSRRVSELFRDRPMPPLETAIWWVEYVSRSGGAQLRSPIRNMPLYQYLLLDVIGFLILGAAILLYIINRIVRNITNRNTNKSKRD